MDISQFFRRWLLYTTIEGVFGSALAFVGGVFLATLIFANSYPVFTDLKEFRGWVEWTKNPTLITGIVFSLLLALFYAVVSKTQWRIDREAFESRRSHHFREYPKWVYDNKVGFRIHYEWVLGLIFTVVMMSVLVWIYI